MLEKKFLIYIFSFLGGVLIHSLFLDAHISQSIFFFIIVASFILFLFGKELTKVIALSVVIFLLGFLRFDFSLHPEQKHILDYFANEKIELKLEGKISERPIKAGASQSFSVKIEKIIFGNKKENIETSIKLKTFDYQDYHFGQKITFSIIPEIPEKFETEGGRFFDYEHFLEKDRIYYVGKSYDVKIIEEAPKSLFSFLYTFKDNLLKQINRHIRKPESSLLAGVLLGEKTALGDELEDDFRTTGLMHIVVLSGYNVSIVIMAVMFMLAFLPLYTRSIIAVAGIVAFALLVGAGPTVIRASIMALFVVLAKIVGKPYHIERTLLLAGAFMVLYNPWVLLFDISFQFSFLATYGLIVIMPLVEEKITFIPKFLALRDSAAATISAQIMVMPLILYYIGDFSVISVLVNMLVLFIIPATMFLGFITAVFGFFSPWVASIIAIPASLSLSYILALVKFFAHVPFAKFFVQKFSFWWIILYYFLLFVFLFKNGKQKTKNLDEVSDVI